MHGFDLLNCSFACPTKKKSQGSQIQGFVEAKTEGLPRRIPVCNIRALRNT